MRLRLRQGGLPPRSTTRQDGRGAHKEHEELVHTTAEAQKALEAERETTAHKLSELGALKREWQSCFLLY
jgi:hypothetical protein